MTFHAGFGGGLSFKKTAAEEAAEKANDDHYVVVDTLAGADGTGATQEIDMAKTQRRRRLDGENKLADDKW